MNIEHMRAFLEVTVSGSFQQAAERLNVTQSTVSARIKALEDRLNRPLFLRKRAGAELTGAGHHFHRHALTAVRAWERARQEIALPEDLTAIVSLGVQLNHWDRIAPPWLAWMRQELPDVATQIVSDYSDRMMRQLRDGFLDLAVLYDPQHCPGVAVEQFGDEALVLVSTEPRRLGAGRVPGYVYVDWGEIFRAEHSLAFPEAPGPRLSVGLSAVGLDHILKHGGSGYFLENSVAPMLADGRLFRVEDAPVFHRPTYLVYPESPVDEGLAEAAIRGLKRVAGGDTTAG